MRLLTLTTAALLLAAPLLRADDRKPPPDADAQAKSEALIKDLFKEDFAKRKPADLQALAAKLVQQAADTKNDAAGQFVLLRLAAEVAAKAGDAPDALQAIDAQAKDFAVNAAVLKAKALEAILKPIAGAQVDYQAVLDAALPAADEVQTANDFDSEAKLLHAAQVAATKLDKKPAATVASERGKMVEAMQKEYDNIKPDLATLKDKPDDPDASLHVGRFLCFFKGDWDGGLPLLAVGTDAKLRDLAKKDINGPAGAADQAALADAWMVVADAETGIKAQQIQPARRHLVQAGRPPAERPGQGEGRKKAERHRQNRREADDAGRGAGAGLGGAVPLRRPAHLGPAGRLQARPGRLLHPAEQAPDGVQFLKLKLIGTGKYVIIPMTNDALNKATDDGQFGWNGENKMDYHGFHLGIYALPLRGEGDIPKDNVVLYSRAFKGSALGWGFGHRIHRDDFQGYTGRASPWWRACSRSR